MYPHFDQRRTRTLAALAGVSAVSLSLSAHAAAAPNSPRTTTSIVAPLTTVVPPFAVGPAHSVGVHPSNPLNFTVTSKHVFGTNITHADVLRSAEAAQADHDHALISEMIAAGNSIATLPYIWGGGHGTWVSPGYDCSGSVSFVLHAAGLLSTPEDSSQLMSYGVPGPGKYVTIYTNEGHAWMTINGRRFDTIALQETGTRWSDQMMPTAGYTEVHPAGL